MSAARIQFAPWIGLYRMMAIGGLLFQLYGAGIHAQEFVEPLSIPFSSEGYTLSEIDSIIEGFRESGTKCQLFASKILRTDRLEKEARYGQSIAELKQLIYSFPVRCDSTLLLRAYDQLASTHLSVRNYRTVDSIYKTVRAGFDSSYVNTNGYFGLMINRSMAYWFQGYPQRAKRLCFDIVSGFEAGTGKIVDSIYLQKALNNLGSIYGNQNQLDSAAYYFTRASRLARARGEGSMLVALKINLANINSDLNKYHRAVEYYREARQFASNSGDLKNLVNIEYNWAIFHRNRGEYDSAYFHLKRHSRLKDSMLNAEKLKAVADAEEKYEAERKRRRIQQLKTQNYKSQLDKAKAERTRNYFIMGGMVLLLASLGLWWRARHSRRAKRRIEKEKERSERLLLNILPEEIAEELKTTGEYNARHHTEVSIMFADFKDFTQTSEQMNAEDLVDEIDYCFKAFDKICSSYQLEKIKTIGDCYMAAGGLPVKQGEDAKNTVSAALDMQEFLMKRKQVRENQGQIGFEMRIGIHTGPVVAGVVGSDKFSYDIWGDTVNTASRIESTGEVGKVNISRETFELLEDSPEFTFHKRGKVHAKHKGEVDMYFVERRMESKGEVAKQFE